ncbi:tRNA lysidine(34) synthetase TilS [Pasteurellaceae bacterium RH1A]|nr:tRNA lysidine(34) synthetase TilS [Pasteurellaceae bacterium RH1A]
MIFPEQLKTHLNHQSKLLLALSGGLDSVVLFHLLLGLKRPFRAIHVHHGLSPHADDWADFCRELCQTHQIPFLLKKVQLSSSANLEAQAREARYQAVREVIWPDESLVTAHHQDDQAETFFLALKRGSGLKGLSAMAEQSQSHGFPLIRPLLNVSKTELLAYAQAHNLNWISDESNQSDRFDRNFLRNQILPQLTQRWPHFSQMVARSAQLCRQDQALLEELLAEELNKRLDLSGNLQIEGFGHFSPAKQQALLRLWLAQQGQAMPSQVQLEQIIKDVLFAQADKNPQFKLGDKLIRRYQACLYLTAPLEAIEPFSADLKDDEWLELPANLGKIKRSKNQIFCKKSPDTPRLILPQALSHQPLSLKLGWSGKVQVYGKTQREDLKKIFQSHSLPVWLRDRTPLIFCGEDFVGLISL